mmetsp:Transcript_141/g.466  ORF Transcript_141/g.466 Transcript_141/m.466 type:complete len:153 (+) Transcript_141:433-891(+)
MIVSDRCNKADSCRQHYRAVQTFLMISTTPSVAHDWRQRSTSATHWSVSLTCPHDNSGIPLPRWTLREEEGNVGVACARNSDIHRLFNSFVSRNTLLQCQTAPRRPGRHSPCAQPVVTAVGWDSMGVPDRQATLEIFVGVPMDSMGKDGGDI